MSIILQRVQSECQALLTAFAVEGKVSKDKIPTLPTQVNPLSSSPAFFSLTTAQTAIGPHFDALSKLVKAAVRSTALPSLQGRQRKIMASIGYYSIMKERYDVQVSTAVCGALIALRVMPTKFGPVVKSVMDGIRVSPLRCCCLHPQTVKLTWRRKRRMRYCKFERLRALPRLSHFATRHSLLARTILVTRSSRIFSPSYAKTSPLHLCSLLGRVQQRVSFRSKRTNRFKRRRQLRVSKISSKKRMNRSHRESPDVEPWRHSKRSQSDPKAHFSNRYPSFGKVLVQLS